MPTVALNLITMGVRARAIGDAQVASLANSIAEVGLLNPITVYRLPFIHSGVTTEGYSLIAGAHRLEACKRLGWAEIPVYVVDLDELHRTIAECDENLCGTSLSPSERSEFTQRRKIAYEALHPNTRHGGDRPSRQVGDFESTNEINRFTKDTAASTGKGERSIQRDADRGEKISPDALGMIKGTHLDTGVYLDKIKDTAPEDQVGRVEADLAKPVAPKRQPAPKYDDAIIARQVAILMKAWNSSSRQARDAFLIRIGMAAGHPARRSPSVERLN